MALPISLMFFMSHFADIDVIRRKLNLNRLVCDEEHCKKTTLHIPCKGVYKLRSDCTLRINKNKIFVILITQAFRKDIGC